MSTLGQKVVLITGAKGGLGTSVTHAFLDAGATVIGVSRSIEASDFPRPGFVAMPAELSNAQAVRTLANAVAAEFQGIDVLVHLIGGFAGGKSVTETDEATFDRMLDMNLRSAFYIASAVVPHMRSAGSGRILAIGSRAAIEPVALVGAYSASKAALISLIRTLAIENKDRYISANIILPATIDTPANRAADPSADFSKWIQPSRVANLLLYLASDAGAQISGAVIPVYGWDL